MSIHKVAKGQRIRAAKRVQPLATLPVLLLASLLLVCSTHAAQTNETAGSQSKQSLNEIKAAAENGDVKAQMMLGVRYLKGEGVSRDEKEALKWIRLAAEQNVATAQNMVALYYATGNSIPVNYEEAVKWFRLAAEQGFAESQYSLGLCYANGTGVSKDAKEAVRFYRLAAEQGHGPAAYALGHCYSNGNGVPKDDVEAMKWLHLAAVYGDDRALPELTILKRGKSPEQIAEASKRGKEYLEKISPEQLTSVAAQLAINKGEKAESDPSTQHTGIKAFDNLFFGEDKSAVDRKAKPFVKVGERLFELSCGYEKIGGTDRLARVNLTATWTDVQESVIKQNLDEIKEVLSAKFGKPDWHITGDYQGSIGLYEAMKVWRPAASLDAVQNAEELKSFLTRHSSDERYVTQYSWKIGEEKLVRVLLRDRTYKKERKEKIEVQPANWLHEAKFEEVSRFDEHREYKVWIDIESPAVKKTQAEESADPF